MTQYILMRTKAYKSAPYNALDINQIPSLLHKSHTSRDGWFMMLAMDYAIQQINSKQPERITLSSHKLDTCSGQPDYWMDRFSEVSQGRVSPLCVFCVLRRKELV